jgi:hypothetical protein
MRTTGAYILREHTPLKLDSWSESPLRRLKDKADVIELIQALHLPRDLPVDEAIRPVYVETWEALAMETQNSNSEIQRKLNEEA